MSEYIDRVTIGSTTKFIKDTTLESKTAASGGTDTSLVTTGEKYTWNQKYTKPAGGIPATDIASGVIPDVSNKLDTPTTAGTSGQVLTSNGNGGQTWQTPTALTSIIDDTAGDGVTNKVWSANKVYDELASKAPTSNPSFSGTMQNGGYVTATGSQAHAEGHTTTATGTQAHSEGNNTIAGGSHSHSEGLGTLAAGDNERVSGTYNSAEGSEWQPDTNYSVGVYAIYNNRLRKCKTSHKSGTAFEAIKWETTTTRFLDVVGNGTSDSDRSNARSLDVNGNEWLKGTLYINANANGTGGSEVATLSTVSSKADKVSNPTNGNFAALDSNGNLTDSGHKHSDYGTYSKPSGGIPKTDLASAVQTSLDNADSAYQKPSAGIPATDMASGVIPDISGKINEPSTDGTSGQVLATDGNGGRYWKTESGGGGGTSDYNDLSNKPQIAGVTLSGNKTLSDLGIASSSALSNKIDKVVPSGGFYVPYFGSDGGLVSTSIKSYNMVKVSSLAPNNDIFSNASQAYSAGDYFFWNRNNTASGSALYRALTDIPSGTSLVIGTNVELVTGVLNAIRSQSSSVVLRCDLGTITSLPVTMTVPGVTDDMTVINYEIGTPAAFASAITVTTDTDEITLSGTIVTDGSSTVKIILSSTTEVSQAGE